MAKNTELDENPEEQVIEVEEVASEEPTEGQIKERITQLKAIAYDHISTIEKLQSELRQVNEAIETLSERLNPVGAD
jgi:TolA-binding protein